MAMQALRDGAAGGILKFILFGLLALAAGGLVFTDVGGFFRGGVGSNDVAKVAGQKIPLLSFDRTLRRALSQIGLDPQQAYQLGYTNEVLNGEIRRHLLVKAANDSGIVVDKSHVIEQVQTILVPAIQSGMTTDEALATFLRNQGMTEGELVNTIASERALVLLSGAIQGGSATTTKVINEDLYAYQFETRDIEYIPFYNKDVTGITPPTEEELESLYEGTKETFAIAETRDLDLLTIKTDNLEKTLSVSDEDIQAAYEDNIAEYTTPAQRTITQAIFKTEEAAQTAYEETSNGKTFKQATSNADVIPAKAFNETNILEELSAPVFESEETGILEPVKTPLGWTLINITKIEEETVKPLEAVEASIRNDITQDMLIDEIYNYVDEVDEFFASGGMLSNAREQFDLDIQTITDINAYGQDKDGNTPLRESAGDDGDNAAQQAFSLEQGQTSAIFETADGKFMAVHVAEITPKTYQSFEDVKSDLEKQWMNDQKKAANTVSVMALKKEAADKSLADLAKESGKTVASIKDIKRSEDPKEPIADNALMDIFTADQGAIFTLPIDGGLALAKVNKVQLPETIAPEELENIAKGTAQDTQQENFVLYINAKGKQYGAKINESLLERTYGAGSEAF